MTKKEEFDSKIGSCDSDYCERCRKTTSHRWIREIEDGGSIWGGPATDRFSYYLRCKECPHKVLIYKTADYEK